MKAIIGDLQANGQNLSDKKELVATWNLIIHHQDRLLDLMTVRCWTGRSRPGWTIWASFWLHGNSKHASGHGKVSGWGFDHYGPAITAAIESAGITLLHSMIGTRCEINSSEGIPDALLAIAVELGYDPKQAIVIKNA